MVVGIAVVIAGVFGSRYWDYHRTYNAALNKYEAGLEKYGFDRFKNGWEYDFETYIDDIQYVVADPERSEFSYDEWGIRNHGVYAVIDPESTVKLSTGAEGREIPYHIVLSLYYDNIKLDVYEDSPEKKELYYRTYEGLVGSYESYSGEGIVPADMEPVIKQIYESNKEVIDNTYAQAIEIRDALY